MSDFAPYQPAPDDRSRLSKAKLKAPVSPPKPSLKYQPIPTQSSSLTHSASALEAGIGSSSSAPTRGGEQVQGQIRVNKYETSLPVRVDVEAALTYALGAVTVVEQKNDYVRFHAWQVRILWGVLCNIYLVQETIMETRA
ncbi:hypothetical protein BC936DRAFT_142853 [Jimgerdemannia flammicorona]|uniref:Uncharacterized protein n=1 Tax=Jimgerdemannia flammicorona TaxID=994334 RepID=A0A433DEK5_9FUNG|nr:hypothetical protein BC936DRAFT_142853 [Jimgerdemannia flammicorona]